MWTGAEVGAALGIGEGIGEMISGVGKRGAAGVSSKIAERLAAASIVRAARSELYWLGVPLFKAQPWMITPNRSAVSDPLIKLRAILLPPQAQEMFVVPF